jgi:DNA-binding phage protein
MPRSRSYRNDLLQDLQDPQETQEYINAALEDDDPQVFLLALHDVVDAYLGTICIPNPIKQIFWQG